MLVKEEFYVSILKDDIIDSSLQPSGQDYTSLLQQNLFQEKIAKAELKELFFCSYFASFDNYPPVYFFDFI